MVSFFKREFIRSSISFIFINVDICEKGKETQGRNRYSFSFSFFFFCTVKSRFVRNNSEHGRIFDVARLKKEVGEGQTSSAYSMQKPYTRKNLVRCKYGTQRAARKTRFVRVILLRVGLVIDYVVFESQIRKRYVFMNEFFLLKKKYIFQTESLYSIWKTRLYYRDVFTRGRWSSHWK